MSIVTVIGKAIGKNKSIHHSVERKWSGIFVFECPSIRGPPLDSQGGGGPYADFSLAWRARPILFMAGYRPRFLVT